MSGGGSKPRGGKMGTSIRASSVSVEAVTNAERELSGMSEKLNGLRQRIMDAVRRYQSSEKAVAALEMELAKSQKEVLFIFCEGTYFWLVQCIDYFFQNRLTV